MPPGSVVEIKGSKYRYSYDPETQQTVYQGPLGEAPALSEQDFIDFMRKRMKIYMQNIVELDAGSKKGYIRRLEVELEGSLRNPVEDKEYVQQFFSDLSLHGLDEAIDYVRGHELDGVYYFGTVERIEEISRDIKKEIGE